MNIGIFTATYLPTVNGVVYHVADFKKAFEKLGHTVYVFTPVQNGYKDKEKHIVRLPSVPNPIAESYPIILPFLFTKKDMRKYKLDVVHTHHPFGISMLAHKFANDLGIPLVYTNHTQAEKYVEYYSPVAKKEIKKLVVSEVKRFCNKCNLVIAPTVEVKKMLKGYNTRAKIEIVTSSLDTDFFKNTKTELKSKLTVPASAKVLLYAGRVSEEKNLGDLIDLFRKTQLENTYLVIAGDGPHKEKLMKQAEKLNTILFTGNIQREDLPKYYSIADYFISLSVTEVMPLTIIEALSCNVPVIGLKNAGLDSFLQNGTDGFLMDRNRGKQVKQLRQAVGIINTPKFDTLKQNARTSALKYSVENSAKQLISLYSGLIN